MPRSHLSGDLIRRLGAGGGESSKKNSGTTAPKETQEVRRTSVAACMRTAVLFGTTLAIATAAEQSAIRRARGLRSDGLY